MRKAASILALLGISITVTADEWIPTDDNDNTYTTRTAVMAITEKTVHGAVGGKNPSHLRMSGPFVTAEFLYWQAQETGIDFAIETKPNAAGTRFNNSNIDFHGEWRPGFRLGVGWLFGDRDSWDVAANWTYFYDKASKSVYSNNPGNCGYIPYWSPILGPVATKASGQWDLHYNTLDIDVGRDYFISEKISVRPYAGIRAAWIDQDYDAAYQGVWIFSIVPSGVAQMLAGNTSFEADWSYKAAGVRGGADLMWHFGPHVGLFSQLSAALLYGKFDIDQKFDGKRPSINGEESLCLERFCIAYDRKYNRVRANIEAFLGLFYETGISNNKYHFFVSAGYELSEWFQQNELIELSIEANSRVLHVAGQIPPNMVQTANTDVLTANQSGDLGLQGLSIKACFNF